MATWLRQVAADALVVGGNCLPGGGPRRRLLCPGAGGGHRRICRRLVHRALHGRTGPRAPRRPHNRWPALLSVHRGQVQSRRHSAADMGLGGVLLPRGAATKTGCLVGDARRHARLGALGEIFRDHAGGAYRSVSSGRPRGARRARHHWSLARSHGGRSDHGTASPLALAERLPSVCLCQCARRPLARLSRSHAAPDGVCAEPAFVSHSRLVDCCRPGLAATENPCRAHDRRFRSAHHHASGFRPGGDHHRPFGAQRTPCGDIRSGCFSGCGS